MGRSLAWAALFIVIIVVAYYFVPLVVSASNKYRKK